MSYWSSIIYVHSDSVSIVQEIPTLRISGLQSSNFPDINTLWLIRNTFTILWYKNLLLSINDSYNLFVFVY